MAFGEPMYVPLPSNLNLGGRPAVFEKNTFLEFLDAPPASFDIRRSETEPARRPGEAEVWHDCVETPAPPEGNVSVQHGALHGWIEGGSDFVDTSSYFAAPAHIELERFETPPGLLELARYDSPQGFLELERFDAAPGVVDLQRYESYDWFERPQHLSLVNALPAMPATMPLSVGFLLGTEAAECLPTPSTPQMSLEGPALLTHSTFDILRPFLGSAAPPSPPANPAPEIKERLMPAVPLECPRVSLTGDSLGVSRGEERTKVSNGELSETGWAPLRDELRPNVVTQYVSASGRHCISWAADARKLDSWDKQLVSPQFRIDVPEHGEHMFKIVLYPMVVNDGKHGAAFKKAKGRGRVVLKCDSELPASFPDISFYVSNGVGDKLQTARGPVTHNFVEQSCAGLRKEEEEWHFNSAVGESKTCIISIEISSFQPATR